LLLVGDGQQAVYPGGYTLSEAGVSVTGRATVLNRNYRNAVEIFTTALEVVRSDLFDDLDADSMPGAREVVVDRRGGVVVSRTTQSFVEQRTKLIGALQAAIVDGVRSGEIAVLVKTRRDVETWLVSLRAAGLAASQLTDYDGTATDAVKVGTYQRAKGLEFACVFLPDYDRAIDKQLATETDDAYRERAELQRRQLFVAMTRARDRLWLGSRGQRAAFVR
jgi:superfamily I DNA/RNA helicase